MNKSFLIFIYILISLSLTNLIFAESIKKTFNEYSTTINGTPELIKFISENNNIKTMEQLLKNLDLFNQETDRFNSFKISNLQIEPKTTNFNNLLIKAEISQKNFEFKKNYTIQNINQEKANKILSFSFIEEDKTNKIKNNFTVFNQSYDSNGNLIKRMIIQSKNNKNEKFPLEYQEFINGRIIEYENYTKAYFPTKVTIKYFILNSLGEIKFFETYESTNREYNNKGFLTKETSKKTSFPYSKATPFTIYNLKFSSNFDIESFEVIFPEDKTNTFYSNAQNYEVVFNKYQGNQFIKKTIRKFALDEKVKTFTSGRIIERELSKNKIIKTKEMFFDIKDGTNGLEEKNRIYNISRDIFNLNFDKNENVLQRNIIDSILHQNKDTFYKSYLFKSLKKVQYKYDNNKMVNAEVSLFAYNNDKKLTKIRTLNLDVTNFDKTGEPLSISIKTITPDNPKIDIEKTFNQNTTYILQDAIFEFRYFILPATNFIAEIKKVSDRGEIEEAFFTDKK